MRRRVVVTGMGVVSPLGLDLDETWTALLEGVSGAGPITQFSADERFSVRIACEVKGFKASAHMPRKEARRLDRFSQLAIAASQQAMRDAGLEDGPSRRVAPERCGALIGSGVGGIATFEKNSEALIKKGPGRVSPFFVPMFIADIASGLVSIHYGLKGPNYCTLSACASSSHAIGEAARHIERGDADMMLTGGSEACVTPITVAGFAAMKAMSTRNDDPKRASRPFDADRDGFVIGEGAACLVLEGLDVALERGAEILGEVAGYGLSGDAHHITAPPPGGEGAIAAMAMAVRDAGAELAEVGYVNAHGTSTPYNDRTETQAIRALFKDHADELVVGSTKSMTGHLLGAAGALEAVICLQVCRTGRIPPTINFETADPDCDLEYAHGGAMDRSVGLAVSNSFGFGGHNACLALRPYSA